MHSMEECSFVLSSRSGDDPAVMYSVVCRSLARSLGLPLSHMCTLFALVLEVITENHREKPIVIIVYGRSPSNSILSLSCISVVMIQVVVAMNHPHERENQRFREIL